MRGKGKELCGSAIAFAVLKARHTQGAPPPENPQHGGTRALYFGGLGIKGVQGLGFRV